MQLSKYSRGFSGQSQKKHGYQNTGSGNKRNTSEGKSRKKGKKNGGVDRSRTGLSDFADRCLTDWLPRLIGLLFP